jgi:hypothetical protein
MEPELHRVPRYRQRLAHTPIFAQPVWVDDQHFNLAYHIRHTHLPRPGDERQLKRLAARLMSQELDRGKPLWEMWVVEGLTDDRFAIITKAQSRFHADSHRDLIARARADSDVETHVDPPPRWTASGALVAELLVRGRASRGRP